MSTEPGERNIDIGTEYTAGLAQAAGITVRREVWRALPPGTPVWPGGIVGQRFPCAVPFERGGELCHGCPFAAGRGIPCDSRTGCPSSPRPGHVEAPHAEVNR